MTVTSPPDARLGPPPHLARPSRLNLRERVAVGEGFHVLAFDGRIDGRPGQFAMIRGARWGAAPLLPRPMSLLSSGDRPSILVQVVGEGTRRFADATPGEPFDVLAPLGVPFEPPPEGTRAVLVAEGAGLAPLLFLARQLAGSSRHARPMAIFVGTTSARPLEAELAAVSDLRVAASSASAVAEAFEAALDEIAATGAPTMVFTRASDPTMAAVVRLCAARGVRCQVSLSTPMACGHGVCLGCAVPRAGDVGGAGYLYACTEGPCVDATAIAWKRPVGS